MKKATESLTDQDTIFFSRKLSGCYFIIFHFMMYVFNSIIFFILLIAMQCKMHLQGIRVYCY